MMIDSFWMVRRLEKPLVNANLEYTKTTVERVLYPVSIDLCMIKHFGQLLLKEIGNFLRSDSRYITPYERCRMLGHPEE